MAKISFKNVFTKASMNIAKEGIAYINLKGTSFALPIKIAGITKTIMDIEAKPNKLKLKTIIKNWHNLDKETQDMIENSEGFDDKEKRGKVKIYDMTDEETARELKRTLLKSKLLEVVKDIDMYYVDEDMGINLWKFWEIPDGDYNSLAEWFLEMDVDDTFISELSIQIAKIKNGTMLEALDEIVEEENTPSDKPKRVRKTKAQQA